MSALSERCGTQGVQGIAENGKTTLVSQQKALWLRLRWEHSPYLCVVLTFNVSQRAEYLFMDVEEYVSTALPVTNPHVLRRSPRLQARQALASIEDEDDMTTPCLGLYNGA